MQPSPSARQSTQAVPAAARQAPSLRPTVGQPSPPPGLLHGPGAAAAGAAGSCCGLQGKLLLQRISLSCATVRYYLPAGRVVWSLWAAMSLAATHMADPLGPLAFCLETLKDAALTWVHKEAITPRASPSGAEVNAKLGCIEATAAACRATFAVPLAVAARGAPRYANVIWPGPLQRLARQIPASPRPTSPTTSGMRLRSARKRSLLKGRGVPGSAAQGWARAAPAEPALANYLAQAAVSNAATGPGRCGPSSTAAAAIRPTARGTWAPTSRRTATRLPATEWCSGHLRVRSAQTSASAGSRRVCTRPAPTTRATCEPV